jgi:hypothetical protein
MSRRPRRHPDKNSRWGRRHRRWTTRRRRNSGPVRTCTAPAPMCPPCNSLRRDRTRRSQCLMRGSTGRAHTCSARPMKMRRGRRTPADTATAQPRREDKRCPQHTAWVLPNLLDSRTHRGRASRSHRRSSSTPRTGWQTRNPRGTTPPLGRARGQPRTAGSSK